MSKITITKIGTQSCSPCKLVDKVLADYQYVTYIDADEDPQLAQMLGVVSVPTIVFYKDSREYARHTGVVNKAMVDDYLKQGEN